MAARRRKNANEPEVATSNSKDRNESNAATSQIGMRVKKKGRWWQCGPVKVFILIFVSIFVLNYGSLKREYTFLMPPGELKDIGWGQKLFIRCSGTGEPVVLLDAPTGETSDIWTHVESSLNKYTKVCVYDRAGLGFSDRAYKNTSEYSNDYSQSAKLRDTLVPSTVERMADDLYRLLQTTIGTAPVILVGADFSTLISRFYAQLYEDKVKGLFLIDPMVETLFDNNSTWLYHWYEEAVPHINMLYLGGTVGINRIALMLGLMKPVYDKDIMKTLTKEMINRKKYYLCSSTHLSSLMNEVYLVNDSLKQVKTLFKVKPFPRHIPIVIATYEQSREKDDLTSLWNENQDILTSLIHPTAKLVKLPGQDHNQFYLNPKPVIAGLNNFIKQLRLSATK